MRLALLLTTLSFVAVCVQASSFEALFCCLCSQCEQPLTSRSALFLNSKGLTCSRLDLDMTDPSIIPGSTQCTKLQNSYRSACCDPNYDPLPIVQAPTPSPGSHYPQGEEPPCDVCYGGDYPQKPNTVTAVLYLDGNPTCKDLYWMGRRGSIPERLCYPLQLYMEEPCGCMNITETIPQTEQEPELTEGSSDSPTMTPGTSHPTNVPTHTPSTAPTTSRSSESPTPSNLLIAVDPSPPTTYSLKSPLPSKKDAPKLGNQYASRDYSGYGARHRLRGQQGPAK